MTSTAKHLSYLAETGDLAKGLKLVERHLPWALDSFDLEARLDFYGACCRLTRLLSQRKRPRRKLRLPKTFPGYRDDDTYDTGELAAWFQREAEQLARRFDERNGNGYRSSLLEERISGALMRPPGAE